MTVERIGIVGGVGPLAAAHFYRRVIELSPVDRDEDHLPVVLVSESVPSRIDHLLGHGPSPAPVLRRVVRILDRAGAQAIAVPSATTHAYLPEMRDETAAPIFDLLDETARAVQRSLAGRVAILATRPTVALGLYEPHLSGAIAVYPDEPTQQVVDRIITGVKRGEPLSPLRTELTRIVRRLRDADTCVVLGCTELSVVAPLAADPLVIDASETLARHVVRSSGLITAGPELSTAGSGCQR